MLEQVIYLHNMYLIKKSRCLLEYQVAYVENYTSQQDKLICCLLNSIFNWLENVCVSNAGAGHLSPHYILKYCNSS